MSAAGDQKQRELVLSEALRKVAPGTELREGIDLILSAEAGALIVIGDYGQVEKICNGGFTISADFTANRLAELAKMDGAIVIDDAVKKILKFNVHLVPDPALPTSETGTRHRTAERVSRQTNALVIAISESRHLVSIYFGGQKYILEDISTLLSRANQALQTLERYRNRFDQVSVSLSSLEFQDLATLSDVVSVIQRAEMLERVAAEIDRYVLLLGSEGRLIRMQQEELVAGVSDEYLMIIRDYVISKRRPETVKKDIAALTPEGLLDPLKIARTLGFDGDSTALDEVVSPRGFRLLKKIPRLPLSVASNIVVRFKDLRGILKASVEELDDVEGVGEVRARAIYEGLRRLRDASAGDRAFL